MRRFLSPIVLLLLLFAPGAAAQGAGLRGEPAAVAAAHRLLEQAGGAAWRARTFEADERLYRSNGEVADVRIARDFARPARLIVRNAGGQTFTEWVSPEGGWTRVGAVTTPMSAAELAAEIQGLRQEPYSIYHRIARNDPALRVEARANGTLYFFDRDERMLAWFQVAPNGVLLGWGCFYDGAVNQHYYGPVADLGDANLPRFGGNERYRFEYLSASLRDAALAEPRE